MGKQRLLAIGGEEGGVRIIDVDEGLGVHREEKGQWWRAHPNAVFDLKWSGDDTRIVRPNLSGCVALTYSLPRLVTRQPGFIVWKAARQG
jgi:denticleless